MLYSGKAKLTNDTFLRILFSIAKRMLLAGGHQERNQQPMNHVSNTTWALADGWLQWMDSVTGRSKPLHVGGKHHHVTRFLAGSGNRDSGRAGRVQRASDILFDDF